MSDRTEHPNLAELVQALRGDPMDIRDHVKNCRQCREVYEVLEWSGAAKGRFVWEPPRELVARLKAVPQIVGSRHPRRSVQANMAFDSWFDRPAVAVRKAPFGVERRMRFEASGYVLDLAAEKQLDGWHFVARATDRDAVVKKFVLRVGRRKLHPATGGCFFWTAKRPPRSLSLMSSDLKIEMGRLKW